MVSQSETELNRLNINDVVWIDLFAPESFWYNQLIILNRSAKLNYTQCAIGKLLEREVSYIVRR